MRGGHGGGSAFCAGAEVATLRGAANGEWDDVETVYQGFLRVRDCPLPTIAAVDGLAVGAGFNLALACDVLAGPGALFDARFMALRLHPGGGHAWMLARAVGQQQATLACLFGETWDAQAAVRAGLAAAVVDTGLLDTAVALGQRLAHQEKVYVGGWSPRCGVHCPPCRTRTRWRRRLRRSAGPRAVRPSSKGSAPSRTASPAGARRALKKASSWGSGSRVPILGRALRSARLR